MTKHSDDSASKARTVTLLDRNANEATYLLLSGDPEDKVGGLVTARASGDRVDVRSWYWSSLDESWVCDPESGIDLERDEVVALAEAIPLLLGAPAASGSS